MLFDSVSDLPVHITMEDIAVSRPLSPSLLLHSSEEYLLAGKAAHAVLIRHRAHRGVPTAPVLHLLGRSIEMALKAFLLHSGQSMVAVHSLGSDLRKLRIRAFEDGMQHVWRPTPLEVAGIDILGALLVSSDFRYGHIASLVPPPFDLAEQLASRSLQIAKTQIHDCSRLHGSETHKGR